MSEENRSRVSPDAVVVSRKSWIAYVGLLAKGLLALAACVAIYLYLPWEGAPWLGGGLGVATLLVIAYHLLEIRSVKLYYDQAGVWCFEGVLPWRKGVHGVKWRDLDEVLYSQGFWPWLLRSHRVRINHRYTKAAEIDLTHMQRGDLVTQRVNARHVELIGTGVAD